MTSFFNAEDRLTAEDSPSLARRRVRLALRELREAANLTQAQVAEATDFSMSKVIRIESGEVTIAPNDLRALLPVLGVSAPERIEAMVNDAKIARSRPRNQWWSESRFKDHVPEALRRFVQFERTAVTLKLFGNYLVPGPLQTESFARAVLHRWQDNGRFSLTAEDVEMRLEARMRRREALLGRTDAPEIHVLLDESTVLRLNGSAKILADQLTDTLSLVKAGKIILRVIPFDSLEAPLPTIGTFDLLYLNASRSDEDAVIYYERDVHDGVIEDAAEIAYYRQTFEKMWESSLDEQATIALVQSRLPKPGAGKLSREKT